MEAFLPHIFNIEKNDKKDICYLNKSLLSGSLYVVKGELQYGKCAVKGTVI